MNIQEIEENLKSLIDGFDKKEFIYELLLAYGLPKASITRLKKGSYDLSDKENVVSWKKRVFYKEEHEADLHEKLMELAKQAKNDQRFIIVTDFETLLARDVKTKENLDIPLEDLPKHYDFFHHWAGMEKTEHPNENPADVKAAERIAKIFDEIKKDNPDDEPAFIHGLIVFLSRLLFCFFAEDTNIFPDGQFTNAVASLTQEDGSDLDEYLNDLFEILNTKKNERSNIPAYLNEFPYVNGGLFKNKIESPKFTRRSRQAIINSGELDWSAINPDIFGSMMQAVITPAHRGGLGMHYTSVPNIMKVIRPLFLDELYEEFENAKGKPKKLRELLHRIQNIKIFDPACGSGNFLIITYKELRRLEMKIFKETGEIALSGVTLDQFYGIELDDFAHEIAQLSLWLAEHQMNVEFFKEFGRTNPTLPLKVAGKIVHGNACRVDWESVCPKKDDEVYILGNPPYLGFQERKKPQKEDMNQVFKGLGKVKRLDYIGCWFKHASDYILNQDNIDFAFVSTNSICQGEQISLIWPYILGNEQDIFFAHQSFHWGNNAKHKAGVTVVIVGVTSKNISEKFIYSDKKKKSVHNISPYLIEGNDTIVFQRKEPISNLPEAMLGSSGIDGGNLILSKKERNKFIERDSRSINYIKKFTGGGDFLNSKERYCIWIPDSDAETTKSIEPINERVNACFEYRINGGRDAKKAAEVPHRFFYRKHKDTDAIIFPMTSSGRRQYLPCGWLSGDTIVSNGAFVVYDAEPYIFGIISSKIHAVWMSTTSARMRNDFRYSVRLTYNNFPFPKISYQRKQEIAQCVFRILEEREKHSDKTLADLYDPNNMPTGLKEAHRANDEVIEKCYRSRPFESNEQRLEYLFKLYEEMIQAEKEKDSLFEKQK